MPALEGGRATLFAAGAAAALAGVVAVPFLGATEIVASALLGGLAAAIALEDGRRLRVPDALNLLAAAGGLAWVAMAARSAELPLLPALGRALLAAAVCSGALFLLREGFFRLRGFDGLGLGDVKLGAAGGIWLGWELFPFALVVAALGALALVAAHTFRAGPWPADRRIPLAVYLAPATWLCWYLARLTG